MDTTEHTTCDSHFAFLAHIASVLPQYAGWVDDYGLQRGRVAPGGGIGDHWFAGSDWVCRTRTLDDGRIVVLEVRGERDQVAR